MNSSQVTQEQQAPTETGWAAIRKTWSSRSRWEGLAVAAVPPVAFAVLSTAGVGLTPAVVTAVVLSLAGAVYRLVRHDGLKSAAIGLAITVACAVVASVTGQARGFFLLPALVPFVIIAICLATIVARRPLTGLILNRISGGPRQWWRTPRILRVHLAATSVAVAINVVNAFIQVVFYRSGDTVVLAAAHIATGPIFATLVAVTLVAARRAGVASR